jgi:hypothetical protein
MVSILPRQLGLKGGDNARPFGSALGVILDAT